MLYLMSLTDLCLSKALLLYISMGGSHVGKLKINSNISQILQNPMDLKHVVSLSWDFQANCFQWVAISSPEVTRPGCSQVSCRRITLPSGATRNHKVLKSVSCSLRNLRQQSFSGSIGIILRHWCWKERWKTDKDGVDSRTGFFLLCGGQVNVHQNVVHHCLRQLPV